MIKAISYLKIRVHQYAYSIKVAIVGFALVIGVFSLYYTNRLVSQLADREQRQISLFAKAQRILVSPENSANLTFLLTEIIEANDLVPVVLTDQHFDPIDYRNFSPPSRFSETEETAWLKAKIEDMREEYEPIEIDLGDGYRNYIFYTNSALVKQLRYYPLIQLSVLGILALLAYLIFSSSRKAEQNRVWAGLAKETAHQLGTPISSLMAWMELLKAEGSVSEEATTEMEKDIHRLEMITARFSHIGSEPVLKDTSLAETVSSIISYLRLRLSTKVSIQVLKEANNPYWVPANQPLFEWVIENLCKNAVDAMTGKGELTLQFSENERWVIIDVTDTGKGIPKSRHKAVFLPGYTTKKRGWGLGLTLVKRIVELYHHGKIFVKQSGPNGTTFRMMLPKSLPKHRHSASPEKAVA